jgi:isoaspartyl peptidase/L-asparaginase-like protein (Ntn-hydrolase superfamily)
MRISMAKYAVDLMTGGQEAPAAARLAVNLLADKVKGVGGIILIDPSGRIGQAASTEHMAYAFMTSSLAEPVVSV